MMSLTPAAARRIQETMEESGHEGLALRVAATVGPDGEIAYGLGFDEQRDEDEAFVEKGVNLVVGALSYDLLIGTTLDFVEYQPGDFRFIFIPPGQKQMPAEKKSSCGGGGCSGRSSSS